MIIMTLTNDDDDDDDDDNDLVEGVAGRCDAACGGRIPTETSLQQL